MAKTETNNKEALVKRGREKETVRIGENNEMIDKRLARETQRSIHGKETGRRKHTP